MPPPRSDDAHGPFGEADDEPARLRRRIADLQRSEKVLRRSLERLAAAQRVARLGSGEWDLIEDRVWWSEELYRVFEHPQDATPSFDAFLEHVHPEDRSRFRRLLEATFQRGEPHATEFRALRSDGLTRRIRTCAQLERTPDGVPARITWTAQEVPGAQEGAKTG